ncbi:LysR family transcriptional regulator [Albirhodobacter sp. R86504]|uniref:LysR family transcriptional regulator n=1 Tax=Albirhodobacter sp. R86504 TaxID=3093848 RepID=UPI00366BD673
MRKAHIPKLGELQAFVVCAKLGTTTLAAQDLNLTQSAISRAVASLESRLGVALFRRARQRLSLAPAGAAFLPKAIEILQSLEETSMGIMAFGGETSVIRIATLPSFGRRWLMPRLTDFALHHPMMTVDLQVRLGRIDFIRDALDIAVMRKTHEPAGAQSDLLVTETLITVAAPSLIGHDMEPLEIDLLTLPLLQQSTRPTLWLDWFAASKIDPRQVLRGARADHFDMVIDMAVAGMGVAIVPEILVQAELRDGRLRPANPHGMRSGEDYVVITPAGILRPEVATLRDRLLAGRAPK